MTRKKLLNLIAEGESLTIEFKQRFSTQEKIAKEMIAFSNTKGGFLIIGIDDDGSIYGVESEKSEAELIKESAELYCEPPINYTLHFIELNGKEIVAAEIFESENKPHRIQDYSKTLDLTKAEVYVRVNDKSVPASKEMIKILQVKTSKKALKKYHIGKLEKIGFKFLEENETISVKQLSEKANVSQRRASRSLINLVRAEILLIHTKDNGEEYFTLIG